MERITVCGLGKLGSPIAASFAAVGIDVTGYDLDPAKVSQINHGLAPVSEPGLAEAIHLSWVVHRLRATTDPNEAVRGTQACIFIAPTPSLPDGSFDNQYLIDALTKIAQAVYVERIAPYYFIIASTVTPGSCDKEFLPLLQNLLGDIESEPVLKGRFHLVYKPELIALGSVMHDLAYPDVALIGADDDEAAKKVLNLYWRLHSATGMRSISSSYDFKIMSFIEAELAKISLNCAITMKISFANQVGMVAQQLGADAHKILDFVGSDSRIGRKSLRSGMPFGGPCFPRDNRMFQHVARKVGVMPNLAAATDHINEEILQYILDQIPPEGDVGILGLAYKPGAVITEESAGMALLSALRDRGRTVKYHDPLLTSGSLADAARCLTVIVTTDCAEYRDLQFRPDQFVIDPMNVVTKKEMVKT